MQLSTSITECLNEGQAEVVKRTTGPVLVVAGPGSGKTLAIVRRISHMVQQGVSPESILALTFTNRAAREMKDRLDSLTSTGSQKVFVGTLHLLGLRIVRECSGNGYVVYDREEQVNLLRTLLKGSNQRADDMADRISYAKSLIEDPCNDIETIFHEYQAALLARKALDFDDLILKPVEMFDNPVLLKKYRDRFRHIIIDEYQDINPAQYRFLRTLAGDNAHICAVGDPDQAIYAFRGADAGNFLNFEKDFESATEVTLGLNYRSSGNIVGASGRMITHNTKRLDKKLYAVKDAGCQVVVASVPDERAEGEFIVREIESKVGGLSHYGLANMGTVNNSSGYSCCFSDFAVIFRTNSQAQAIEESISEAGIPCRILGRGYAGKGACSRDTISSLKRYSGAIDNKDHLFEMKAQELIQRFAGDHGFESEQITELTNHIKLMIGETWAEKKAGHIVDELNLLAPADDFDPQADAVTLMTLHMAKGLEFRVVFISGVEDGLIPYRGGRGPEDFEEERRLLYVGMTRARDELFLLHKRIRFLYGKRSTCSPSPFLSEIPEVYIQRVTLPDKAKKANSKKQMKLF